MAHSEPNKWNFSFLETAATFSKPLGPEITRRPICSVFELTLQKKKLIITKSRSLCYGLTRTIPVDGRFVGRLHFITTFDYCLLSVSITADRRRGGADCGMNRCEVTIVSRAHSGHRRRVSSWSTLYSYGR